MTGLLVAAMLSQMSLKHACYVAHQFQAVNVPIEPAVAPTEVVRAAVVIGPSRAPLGSVLTLRNGKRYFADLSSQQVRSPDSYALLRALGVDDPETTFAGTLWPISKSVPRPFSIYRCSETT